MNLGTFQCKSLSPLLSLIVVLFCSILSILSFKVMTYRLYNYDPSGAAAIPVAALFGLATVIHIVQMIRARSWFMIPFTIGGVCELFSYSLSCIWLISRSLHLSRGNRLFVQIHQFNGNARLANHALYRTEPPYSSCPCPFCCLDLHDTGTAYCGSECEFELHHSAVMADENFRDWRCFFLLHAMWRYGLLALCI